MINPNHIFSTYSLGKAVIDQEFNISCRLGVLHPLASWDSSVIPVLSCRGEECATGLLRLSPATIPDSSDSSLYITSHSEVLFGGNCLKFLNICLEDNCIHMQLLSLPLRSWLTCAVPCICGYFISPMYCTCLCIAYLFDL